MTFSQTRGFSPKLLLSWIRSEIAEQYRPAPHAPMHDPWWQCDMDYATAHAYVPVEVPW